MQNDQADYLIVGGGSAGAVVAARLSETPSCRVVLIEAGQDTPPGAVPADIADTFPGSYSNQGYAWAGLAARGVAGGEPRPFTQGRVMGGGSSLMGMWALRGLPSDYDAWAAAGASGWGWEDVLPYFCRLERDSDRSEDAPPANIHGHDGPVPIRRIPRDRWPGLAHAFARAAASLGYPSREDINGGDEDDGLFPIPFSQDLRADGMGVRASSAHCYLTDAVRRRPNLVILPHTRARKILFEGSRACGVEVSGEAGVRRIAARQVILCAGAVHSPALLMRSGIGEASALAALGIAPVADLPGVGRNLQNHVFIHIGVTVARGARQAADLRNYGLAAIRLTSSHPEGLAGDLLVSVIGRVSTGPIGTRAGLVTAKLYAPFSRGRVMLAAGDPDHLPDIDFRLLEDERDAARMVEAANVAGRILCDPGVAAVLPDAFILPPEPPLQRLNRPGAYGRLITLAACGLLEAPAALRRAGIGMAFGAERLLDRRRAPAPFSADLVRRSATPMFHVAGTCAMGADGDPMAVTDAACRVRGVQGLRVIDASIMPVVPRANTNIATIMLAERGVDLVRAVPA